MDFIKRFRSKASYHWGWAFLLIFFYRQMATQPTVRRVSVPPLSFIFLITVTGKVKVVRLP